MPTPWYARGLRFRCHQCHNCCRGTQPGWVYVTPRRVRQIANFLETTVESFRRRFVTRDENGDAVLRLRSNGDCVFWNEGCTIYPVRPRQCRTFPFWKETLQSPSAWAEQKEFCHGIDQGKFYSLNEIRAVVLGRSTS